ncbi:MAG: DUF7305 domain-containing protein [Planctomycetota bacterium]
MQTHHRTRQGLALPTAVMLVIFLIILGLAVLELGMMEHVDAKRSEVRAEAFYLAEAGGEKALAIAASDADWKTNDFWDTSHQLGGGSYTVTYTLHSSQEDTDKFTIESTGQVDNQTETVYLDVTRSKSGGGFSSGIFGDDELTLRGWSDIGAYDSTTDEILTDPPYYDIAGSNKLIDIGQHSYITGNAHVAQGGEIRNPENIEGDWSENKELLDLEPVTIPEPLRTMSYTQEGDNGLGGGYSIKNDTYEIDKGGGEASFSGGDYRFQKMRLTPKTSPAELKIYEQVRIYVEHNLNISGTMDITLVDDANLQLYTGTAGKFSIKDSVTVNKGGNPAHFTFFYAGQKQIKISADGHIYGTIYAPEADFQISGGMPVWGGVVANRLDMRQNADIYYDTTLQQGIVPGEPGGGEGTVELDVLWSKEKGWRDYYE